MECGLTFDLTGCEAVRLKEGLGAVEKQKKATMKDNELLEAAANAAGYRVVTVSEFEGLNVDVGGGSTIVKWNPLTNDAAALRLAVKLGLDVKCPGIAMNFRHRFEEQGDPYAATRRAIVRAAAAIANKTPNV